MALQKQLRTMVKRRKNKTAGEVALAKLPQRSADTVALPEERKGRRSLTQELSKKGKIKLDNDLKLLKARKLFVVELQPLSKVADFLELPLSTLQRWAHIHCWDDARAERERAMILRVQGIRHSLVPDIDRKHDEMFSSLERLLETTMNELLDGKVAVPPHQLKILATTLEVCQGGRRTVHKKEQGVRRLVHEMPDNPAFYESFAQSLVDLATRSNGQTSQLPSSRAVAVMDAEFEVVEDDKDAGHNEE